MSASATKPRLVAGRLVHPILRVDVPVFEQPVAAHHALQRGGPVLVVGPPAADVGGCLFPAADLVDQLPLKVLPRVVPELRERHGQPECTALPLRVEGRLVQVGDAGRVQPAVRPVLGRGHAGASASATPIIDSVVTRSASRSSDIPSVPAGRWGTTNHRACPLASHTRTSVSGSSGTPSSVSTARGSRAALARNTGSLYQYGGKPSTGQGKHEHSVQITRLCTPGSLSTAARCSPSAPAMPSGRSSSATAAGVSSARRRAKSGSVQALATIFLPFSGLISDSK